MNRSIVHAPIAVLSIVLSACLDTASTLTIQADGMRTAGQSRETLPHFDVIVHNSLLDPIGLAGLEVEVLGIGRVTAFSAADFGDHVVGTVAPLGRITFILTLKQEGDVVAEGSGEWILEPNVEWIVRIARAPYQPSEGFSMGDFERLPRCGGFWCYRNWRFPIRQDARNYDLEALWLTVYRVHPDECVDLCYDEI